MKKNILVFDVGTQSIRASVIDAKGTILSMAKDHYEIPFVSPKKGWAEQDPEFYVQEMAKVTQQIRKESPDCFATIAGIVCVDFRDSSVILDGDKKPIRNAILWLDERIVELNGKNFNPIEKLLFKSIGMYEVCKKNAERTAAQWLKVYEPENFRKMRYYIPLGAYYNYRITGNLVCSSADCIGHFPIDFKHGRWLPHGHPKYDVFGIPSKCLVPLAKPGSVIGGVSKEFSALSGIPEGIPLFACASDKACETLGNGAIDSSVGSISLGTACAIDVVDHRYSEPEAFLPSYLAPYPGSFDLELQVYSGLWLIRWFTEQFGAADEDAAKKAGLSLEEYLDESIQKIPAGSDGLVLQPYWFPALERPDSKGAIIGFSGRHTRYHLYRAILEGIGYCLRSGLDDIVKKTHRVPELLVVSGGGATSDTLPQMMADIFGIPTIRSNETEGSSLGGAMAGFLDLGVYKTPEEAKAAMVKPGKRYEPDPENARKYDYLYHKVYLRMYPSLKKCYAASKKFVLREAEKE